MENTKKMILIEPEVVERLKNRENVPIKPLSRLDMDMHNILNSKIEDREKWIQYLQILQRYLHFAGEERQPLKLPILAEEPVSNQFDNVKKDHSDPIVAVSNLTTIEDDVKKKNTNLTRYTPNYLFKCIPKSYRHKGDLLVDALLRQNNFIGWDENGVVTINKEVIPGSNISDLIGDTLRPLKREKPIGWQKFAKALKHINFPLSSIGNPQTVEYISQLNLSSDDKEEPTHDYKITPKKNTTGVLHKRKLDWERWNPY